MFWRPQSNNLVWWSWKFLTWAQYYWRSNKPDSSHVCAHGCITFLKTISWLKKIYHLIITVQKFSVIEPKFSRVRPEILKIKEAHSCLTISKIISLFKKVYPLITTVQEFSVMEPKFSRVRPELLKIKEA